MPDADIKVNPRQNSTSNTMLRTSLVGALFAVTSFTALAVGIERDAMDTSTAPGDDFWTYANGAWAKAHPIPADRSSYGVDAVLTEETKKRTVDLIQAAAQQRAPGSDARKVGDYYASFMDEAGHRDEGPRSAAARARSDRRNRRPHRARALPRRQLRADVDVLNATNFHTDNLFGLWVAPGSRRPDALLAATCCRAASACPIATTTSTDADAWPRSAHEVPRAHRRHAASSRGIADADAQGRRASSRSKRRSPRRTPAGATPRTSQKGNNLGARRLRRRRRPGLDWDAYFARRRPRQAAATFIVWQPERGHGHRPRSSRSEPLDDWKDYLTLPRHRARAAPPAEGVRRRALRVLRQDACRARRSSATRWKRAVDATNDALGEAVGKLYVTKYFPASAKARAEEMVKNIIAAFAKRIDALDWMAPETKAKAKAKLATLTVGVGYPDKWRDYSGARGRARRRLRQRRARRACSSTTQPRQARQAGRPRASG